MVTNVRVEGYGRGTLMGNGREGKEGGVSLVGLGRGQLGRRPTLRPPLPPYSRDMGRGNSREGGVGGLG